MRKLMMAAALAVVFGVAGQAAAAVQTFSLHEERLGAVFDTHFGNFHLGDLPMFDPTLGTLNSITLTTTLAFNLQASWDEATGWTGSNGLSLWFDSGFVQAHTAGGDIFTSFEPNGFASVVVGPGDVGSLSTGLLTLPTKSITDTSWPNIFEFIGHKTVDVFTTSLPGYFAECTGSGVGCTDPDVRDTLTVFDVDLAYDYTPGLVPEPGTWMLTLVGVALAGGALRHARRRPVSA